MITHRPALAEIAEAIITIEGGQAQINHDVEFSRRA